MSEQTETTTVTIPTQQSGGFVVPTVGLDGAPLTMAQQFDVLKGNPSFVSEALTAGTPAAAWLDRYNRTTVGLDPLAPPIGPSVAPAKSQDFTLPSLGLDPDSSEFAQADGLFRGWLTDLRLDGNAGSSFASLVEERAKHWAGLPRWDEARDATEAQLRGIYGTQYEQKVALANQLVGELEAKRPGLVAFLEHSGLQNDALVIYRLVSIAEDLERASA